MNPLSWRWSYLITRIAFGLLVVSVPASRILASLSDGTDVAFSRAIAGTTAIVVVVIVALGLWRRFYANGTVSKVRDTLAAQYQADAFLIQKTSRMQSDLKSLKPDLYGSGWNRWSTAMVVTVQDDAFTIWDHDHGRPVEVLSIPWTSVMTVKLDRVGVGARWMDAVVSRVHSGPIKIDLVFPPGLVRRGVMYPADTADVQTLLAVFASHIQPSPDQAASPLEIPTE